MLTIARSVLHHFRNVCRRAGIRKSRRSGTQTVHLAGTTAGYRLQIRSRDLAIEFSSDDPGPETALRLPLDALDACAGRDDARVTFEVESIDRVAIRWLDQGVPRSSEYAQPPVAHDAFPTSPTVFVTSDTDLWRALGDAVECTDAESSRFALGCLNLCGGSDRLEATDGRRALVQAGHRFGWEENLLVPANKLLGCAEIDTGAPIEIGRTDDWVALRVGRWLIQLRIQKEARFPKIDQVVPNPEFARSRLELSSGDARFLQTTLSRMPCDDAAHKPVTLDLNGRVLVRSRELSSACPVEVELRSSKLEGEAIVVSSDRRYLEHALRLGFHQVHFCGPSSPALAVDERRQFVWAVLDKGSAIPRHEQPQKIESPLVAVKIAKPRRAARRRIAA